MAKITIDLWIAVGKKNNAGILFSNLWSTIFLLGKRCYIYHFFKHAHNLRSVCNHGVGLDRSSVQFSVPCLWDCKCTVILCCCWFCILWFLLNNKIRKDKNHSKFFFLIYKIVMYQCMMQYFMGLEKNKWNARKHECWEKWQPKIILHLYEYETAWKILLQNSFKE